MKNLSKITITLAVLFRAGSNYMLANDDVRLVEAIAMVESGADDQAVGLITARAERALGRYQMLPSTWRDRTDWPVEYAHHHLKAQAVAVAHIRWLRKVLEKRLGEGQVTNYHLICAWRYGHAYVGKWDTNEQYVMRNQYIQRVLNMYELGQAPKHQPQID